MRPRVPRRSWQYRHALGLAVAALVLTCAPPPPSWADPVRVQTVPPATGGNAVISVKVGGNRTTSNAVSGLAGVRLGFFDTETGGSPAFTCVSDGDGDCSITVPDTQPLGANRDRRFWIRQVGAAPGTYANPSLGTGSPVAADPYRFRTQAQLRAGTTYLSTVDFMIGTGNNNDQASGGIWQNSADNPVFPASCGIDVGLLLDLSNSVTDAQLVQLKAAANGFVDALTGTPSQVATTTFATSAPASSGDVLGLTSVSTTGGATVVKSKISSYAKPGGNAGGTNWDRGLYQFALSPASYDVVVVITDGNPTYYGNAEGPGNRTRFREVENGVFSANAVKAKQTKVIAFGVGDGIGNAGSGQNLRAISGPVLNSDYFQTTDYTQAGAQLRALALGSCSGSVTVVKEVVPSTAPPGSVEGSAPSGGWTFDATGSTGVTVDPPTSRVTSPQTGAINFPLTFAGGVGTGPVTVTEAQQPGYTLQQVDGANAVCTRVDTGAGVAVTDSGALGFTVAADAGYPVTCTVYNRAPNPLASVVVDKTWVVNGAPYADGDQPSVLFGDALIDSTTQAFGTVRDGYQQGDEVTVDEALGALPPQCTLDSSRLTSVNGTPEDSALPNGRPLAAGLNRFGITNELTCRTRLSLDKSVRFGSADPDLWTLDATGPTGALPGPAGTSGVTADVTPGVVYTLAESEGDPNYVQLTDPEAELISGATGSYFCSEVDGDGTTSIPGYADGLNGGVTVPFGSWIRCTAINETASMRLVKEVVNDNGGSAIPSDWELTVTPTGTVPPGVVPVTRPGASLDDAERFELRPGVGFALSESAGPTGYTNTDVECQIIRPRGDAPATVELLPGDIGTCWFVNDDQPSTLTLVKEVVNDYGGTATAGDWTLSAVGPTAGISGATDTPAVTRVPVAAGSYTLAESNGPAGYLAGAWDCGDAPLTGSDVTVAQGADVTCTVVNADRPATLTLIKDVDNGSTSGTARPGDWTLSATGPVTVTGRGDSGAVREQQVPPGSYTLAESAGPAGYRAGAWSCQGGTLTGDSVAVTVGADVTCRITNTALPASWSIAKLSDPESGSTVAPGDEITYLVALLRNPGIDPTDVVVSDDLSDVLAHASVVDGPVASVGEVSISEGTLTWAVPVLDQDVAFVTYTVRVKANAVGVTLRNVISSPGSVSCDLDDEVAALRAGVVADHALTAGARALTQGAGRVRAAAEDDLCPTATEHRTSGSSLASSSDPASGSELANTGGTGLGPIGWGIAFLLAGAAVLSVARRRRLAAEPVRRHRLRE